MTTLAFLAILYLALRAGADAPSNTVDIRKVLTRAAGDFANSLGSSLATGALNNGVCLARSDDTTNKDKCVNQPGAAASPWVCKRLCGQLLPLLMPRCSSQLDLCS